MDNNIQTKVELFIETFSTLKEQYKWSVGDLSLRFIALVYVLGSKTFEKDKFEEMVKYIKENTQWLSYYRGHQKYSTAGLLITRFDEPQKAFARLLEYEEEMKTGGFKSSQYLSIAAYALLLTCAPEQVDGRIQKAMNLYKEMKDHHFWLTSPDDYPVAVLLSGSDKDTDELVSEIENNYKMLHQEGFSRSNGLQFLSHILTFVPESAQTKAQRTRHIYERLKQERLQVSSMYYGILGYLSLLGAHSEKAVEEVIEVVGYLKSNKNFKWVYKDMNVLAATALVSNQYIEQLSRHNELLETGIGISIEAMISAQTAALIAATSAAAATASAAN